MTEPKTTRRELVRRGAAAAVVLTAADPSLLDPSSALAAYRAPRPPVSDSTVLTSVLRVEQVVVFAYERTLAAGILSPSAHALVRSFLAQERAHVHALSGDLTALRGGVPAAPATMAAFESELGQLRVKRNPAKLHSQREHLHFLVDLETLIARHYRFAIEQLTGAERLGRAAEIMANEAQHATVLLELLSPKNVRRAVPSAFVAGMT